jgi:hypothetical protein
MTDRQGGFGRGSALAQPRDGREHPSRRDPAWRERLEQQQVWRGLDGRSAPSRTHFRPFRTMPTRSMKSCDGRLFTGGRPRAARRLMAERPSLRGKKEPPLDASASRPRRRTDAGQKAPHQSGAGQRWSSVPEARRDRTELQAAAGRHPCQGALPSRRWQGLRDGGDDTLVTYVTRGDRA